ncbi:type IV toxin-antitoxin system AbiEi family antitoxin domain-containing protein [Pedobacter alpinus]|uniref:Type IV toxin-antitoxin system AbiEi family antitoxin domain-containing protein n=1 Tax=Pedobacter alpinus TaxID=1590643 RepID=A0ABW5TPN5_9SPHI
MPLDAQRRKDIFKLVPEGALVTRKWLKSKDLTGHAIDNLVKSQQLESVKNGVYKRSGSLTEWGDIIYFLQKRLNTDLVVGGLSSLELQKLAHYLPISDKRLIKLYGASNLPFWVNEQTNDIKFEKQNSSVLLGSIPDKDITETYNSFTKTISWKNTKEGLKISIPERAILEILNDVPNQISFEHAFELMQGMNTLSPRLLQKLLELCNNIKVRRLFFWFADQLNHPWLAKLDRDKISMGSGNRMIVKGGKLDKKYLITVPESYE